MVVYIPKLIKPRRTIKTNSQQLEIWDLIKKKKQLKNSKKIEKINKKPNPKNIHTTSKNQKVQQNLNSEIRKIYSQIDNLKSTLSQNNPKYSYEIKYSEYHNKKITSTKTKIKCLSTAANILLEYKDTVDNVSILSENLSSKLSTFSKKRILNTEQHKYLNNINTINNYLKSTPTEHYQKAELLVKLSNNIYRLRFSLVKKNGTRILLSEFDNILNSILKNKVPF